MFESEMLLLYLHGVGKGCVQGAGLVREILSYIFIKKTVLWWGKIWFIL